MLGSILSNLLLVLGMSFFLGGIKFKMQFFRKSASSINSGMLTLAVIAILFPTALFYCKPTTVSRQVFCVSSSLELGVWDILFECVTVCDSFSCFFIPGYLAKVRVSRNGSHVFVCTLDRFPMLELS